MDATAKLFVWENMHRNGPMLRACAQGRPMSCLSMYGTVRQWRPHWHGRGYNVGDFFWFEPTSPNIGLYAPKIVVLRCRISVIRPPTWPPLGLTHDIRDLAQPLNSATTGHRIIRPINISYNIENLFHAKKNTAGYQPSYPPIRNSIRYICQ